MNNHFNAYKWLLRHSEDIGGALLAMGYKLFGGTFSIADINLIDTAVKLASDAPGYFMAGFMGGLGGFSIRWLVAKLSKKPMDQP